MRKSLGIFVSSDNHLNKIIKLCKAARKRDVKVTIFFYALWDALDQG